jgi:hypothetical protein
VEVAESLDGVGLVVELGRVVSVAGVPIEEISQRPALAVRVSSYEVVIV